MGLYLPMSKLSRLGHTFGQILFILLTLIISGSLFSDGRIVPMVYLILVIRGCLMFGLAARIALTGFAFVLFLTGLQLRLQSLSGLGRRLPPSAQRRLEGLIMNFQLNFIVLFGLSLLLVVLLINALLTERQSQQRLEQANQTLRQSAQEIEKLAMDQERSRIARDIHDSLGHSLTALNIQLESAIKLWDKDPDRARGFLKESKRLGSQSLQEVRQSVAALQHDPLAGENLAGVIARLLKNFQHNSTAFSHSTALAKENSKENSKENLPITITQNIQINRSLPANLNVVLYRIVQEGLTNILKYANASHIHVNLVCSQAIVTLTLEDNGVGFDPAQARTGFGLQSMRDRAESTGGTFTLTSLNHASGQSSSGQSSNQLSGTRLQVSLPIPQLPSA